MHRLAKCTVARLMASTREQFTACFSKATKAEHLAWRQPWPYDVLDVLARGSLRRMHEIRGRVLSRARSAGPRLAVGSR